MAHDQRSPMVAKIRQRSPTFVGLNSRRRRRRKSRRHRRRDAAAHAERERAAVSRPAPFLFVSLLFWFLFGFFFFDPSLLLCSVSFFFQSPKGAAGRVKKKKPTKENQRKKAKRKGTDNPKKNYTKKNREETKERKRNPRWDSSVEAKRGRRCCRQNDWPLGQKAFDAIDQSDRLIGPHRPLPERQRRAVARPPPSPQVKRNSTNFNPSQPMDHSSLKIGENLIETR